ncbi:ATP-dependent DNA helicase [Comamonas terrigena]|uniref:ATP-dependent DNA helicase n=1 Tax=Comamonas terrigena TaxID=32013 RepID=UPI00244BA993|nr:ATP-dependent DNA helicase [Comamonas terrigena]MDH0050515.1 ATP-dependent DNA helicase [Comamonas terrigena]MDH0513007.1 ATP-dependent DNA helicase [Comamonas terrigena]MDH1092409.1 ATP-dependent DNA helicase [Comamonas terrigena]MDH1502655.1 ATP-dependent DNA helicase [Comamonas terrigena]
MSDAAAPLTVAVRALCEFTARTGDLDLRFTPAPSALEGIEGHAVVRQRRQAPPDSRYEAEVALSGQFEGLQVRGRADGFDAAAQQLEEIKTYRGPLDAVRPHHRALHWAQAKVYGHLLCQARGLARLNVALVYVHTPSLQETVLVQDCSADELQQFFAMHCRRYLDWARSEAGHRQQRNAALAAAAFPMAAFRTGQRQLAVAVYRTARSGGGGRCLMAQAPTGIGKTLGTIFPMLKAMAGHGAASASSTCNGLDKLFFLTAKGTGHGLALHALEHMQTALAQGQHEPLRVLQMRARDTSCEHPDKACHGESCPLAQGFFDRLPAARAEAVALSASAEPVLWDGSTVRQVALQHGICPYYLSQELARWADVVVADYHYFYDSAAMLYALAQQQGWRVGVLVDEAHNLLERARSMYTAPLSQFDLAAARRSTTSATGAVKKALDALQRQWNALNKAQAVLPQRATDSEADGASGAQSLPLFAQAAAQTVSGLREPRHTGSHTAYQSYAAIPPALLAAVQRAIGAIADVQADQALPAGDPVLTLYWALLHFQALAEQFGPHALFDAQLAPPLLARGGQPRTPVSTLCIRNVVPAPHLAARHAAAQATVLFSGTLSPPQFYRDLLGLPADTAWLEVDAPFAAHQLQVRIARHISTRWRDREASLAPLADLIARQYAGQPGNYLCFVSSFDYLQRVAASLQRLHPQLPLWQQERSMDEAGRAAFLERFVEGGQGVGLAVLGSAFAEGVDLPGTRLIGAFVATLGLPQVNPVNEAMQRAMDAAMGAGRGHDYTYLYPGLRKVVQAAGRVIRTEQDRGVVVLVDDRFQRAEVRALLPSWWRVE